MQKNKSSFLENVKSALFANAISIGVAFFLTLFLPKFLTTEQYGYWQLYIFYVAYVGVLHFGIPDGIYLRYGGKYYEKINKNVLKYNFVLLVLLQILFFFTISILSYFLLPHDSSRFAVWIAIAVCCITVNVKTFFRFLLQATNRIRDFSFNIVVERLSTGVIIGIMLVLGNKEVLYLLIADIIARLMALIHGMWTCRDIIKTPFDKQLVSGKKDFIKNISAGWKLLIANTASIFIIGIARIMIEINWDISTFGVISLVLTLSSFFIIIVNTVGQVLFPFLKRLDKNKHKDLYLRLRFVVDFFSRSIFLFIFPIQLILSLWLPKYSYGIQLIPILIPIVLYESKVSLVCSTYLKSMREEKSMMLINVFSVILCFILSSISIYMLHRLDATVMSISIVIMLRAEVFDLLIARKLTTNISRSVFVGFFMTLMFVIFLYYIGGIAGSILYLALYILYIIIYRKNIKDIYINIKNKWYRKDI